jgi:ABC-type tungstate transport system substrate-binding protein
MGLIWDGFTSALRLLWNRDPETMEIVWLSLWAGSPDESFSLRS